MAKTSDKTSLLFKLDFIICTTALVLSLPVALILCIPIAIYRKLVQISAKINQPDLARIVPPTQQAIFHNDLDQDGGYNVITWHVFGGPLKLENLRKRIQEKLINQVGPSGALEFPEFQQYFSLYGGYAFFKWDRTFDVTNHVRYLDEVQEGAVTTEIDLQKIISRLISKRWQQNRSTWEVLVLNNYRVDSTDTNTNKSVLIFRFHHSLADGYSYLNFMVRRICEGENPITAMMSPSRKFTRWEKVCYYLMSTLRQPYDFVKFLRTVNKESSAWNPPPGTLSHEFTVVWSKPVSLDAIKKMKSTYGVSFQGVLNSIIAGTIQGLMTRVDQKVPQIMNASVPFPLANHPGGLCMHVDFSLVKVPIAGKDPVRRLERANKFWMETIQSTARRTIPKVVRTLGCLPWAVSDKILHDDFTNIGLSCFPGIQGDIFLDKKKCLEVNFAVSNKRGSMAATFTTLSCFGALRFVMVVDKTVYPDQNVGQFFNKFIEKEIQSLKDPK